MDLNHYRKSQDSTLRDFKELRKNNPAEAKQTALENLKASGIVNHSGRSLSERYR